METTGCVFQTILGWVGIQSSHLGLQRITFPAVSPEDACRLLGALVMPRDIPDSLASVVERLIGYYSGHRVFFPDDIDLTDATKFQQDVWLITR